MAVKGGSIIDVLCQSNRSEYDLALKLSFDTLNLQTIEFFIADSSVWSSWLIKLSFLGIDKGKYGYIGCISGWFGALREAPRVANGGVRVSGYQLGRRK